MLQKDLQVIFSGQVSAISLATSTYTRLRKRGLQLRFLIQVEVAVAGTHPDCAYLVYM